MAKIKKGDIVQVISGATEDRGGDRGKQGRVIEVLAEKNRVIVEGVNYVTKHVRVGQTQRGTKTGGIETSEASIHISNVALVDPRDGETALHLAAFRGRSAAIQVLLDAGAPVDSHGEHVPTPLRYALCYGSRNCLGPLLRAGATLEDTFPRVLRRNKQNASAFRYMERVQAAGGYDQLVQTYRHVLTAPQSCLSWFLKFHCEIRFGLGAFPHDLVPLVLAFWKPPGGP